MTPHTEIRLLLLKHGKTMKDLAAVLGYTPQWLSRITHGWTQNNDARMQEVWAGVKELTGERKCWE